MSRSLSKKTKDGKGNSLRVVGQFVLLLCSAYAVYHYGVQVGSQQKPYENSILISSPPTSGASTEERLQQSPPSIPSHNVLEIPEGQAQALPSIREVAPEEDAARNKGGTRYGGKGDKQHLGGFTKYDGQGVSPAAWKYMMEYVGVKSIMDVGCGKGVSTLYFLEHGADVLCLEGSHDAVTQTYLPEPEQQVVEHDFSRGPYWPAKTYDAVWSVEFLEHVGRNYQFNYIQAFRKAALIFVTHSRWGGWHHVEVHKDEWWRTKFEMFGFQYSEILTEQIRSKANEEMRTAKANQQKPENLGPDGKYWNAQHVWLTMMVFINPAVAALPEHAHLMAELGCYEGRKDNDFKEIIRRPCKADQKESELPEKYTALQVTPEKHEAWMEKIKARIAPKQQ